MKDLYVGDFVPEDDDDADKDGILEKEAKGGAEDLVARVMLAVVALGVLFFLYSQVA